MKTKVTTVGNSTGIVIPKEALAKLKVKKGDTLYITETADGFELSPYNVSFEEEMKTARDITRRYRNAIRKLAR